MNRYGPQVNETSKNTKEKKEEWGLLYNLATDGQQGDWVIERKLQVDMCEIKRIQNVKVIQKTKLFIMGFKEEY